MDRTLRRGLHRGRTNSELGPRPTGDVLRIPPWCSDRQTLVLHRGDYPLGDDVARCLDEEAEGVAVRGPGKMRNPLAANSSAISSARWWYSTIRGSSSRSPRRADTAYGNIVHNVPP